ncbi:Zn-dependent hydrolase, partial [Mycobacterium tuberculosis]
MLEAERVQIGVVENLQGISWQRIDIRGSANHAGTTPLHLRRDAGHAAAQVAVFARRIAEESGGSTLATIGSLRFEP